MIELTVGSNAMDNLLLMYRSSNDVFPVDASPTKTNFITGLSHSNQSTLRRVSLPCCNPNQIKHTQTIISLHFQ